jgi:hypothetical protein
VALPSRTNVVLSWNPALDNQQAHGLTYNLRVGTTPGGDDIISPMSAPDGFRRVVNNGNAGSLVNYTLEGLRAGGAYYWSVQAVDNSFAGSAFSSEQSFVATVLPTLSSFTDQTVFQDSDPFVLPFTVGDLETPAHELIVSALSSNPQLVGPSSLVVSGNDTNRSLAITLQPNQVGTATITVTVTDGDGGRTSHQFQLVVLPRNHPPVAKIIVSPLITLPGLTNLVAMTLLCDDASLVLDGSSSSDIDGDPLQYAWSEGTNSPPFANGVVVTNRFGPGAYTITLSVSDQTNTASANVQLDVITPAEAVAVLESWVRAFGLPNGQTQALVASLTAAQASLTRCNRIQAINQLHAFQTKAIIMIEPRDSLLAGTLVRSANEILHTLQD